MRPGCSTPFQPGQGLGAGVPVLQPDLASFGTVEEVDAAWSRIEGWVADSADEMRGSLPVGQPEGLKAFADPAAPKLIHYWRYFLPRDLYPAGYAGELGVWSLMTIDEPLDGWHVCFMQDSGPESGSVTNAIERLATAVYREACAITEQRMPKAGGISELFARRRSRRERAKLLDPGRFNFYQHVPTMGGRRETFDRVVLRFDRGEYRNPEWLGYRVIPQVIQSARFDIAPGAAPSDVEGYRLAICDQTQNVKPMPCATPRLRPSAARVSDRRSRPARAVALGTRAILVWGAAIAGLSGRRSKPSRCQARSTRLGWSNDRS
jgi:hypothetical protein